MVGGGFVAPIPGVNILTVPAELKGGYDVLTGGLKVVKGFKQMAFGITVECVDDCSAAGNARKLLWGTVPGMTQMTEGLPTVSTEARPWLNAIPGGAWYLESADWYNGAPREAAVKFLEGPRPLANAPAPDTFAGKAALGPVLAWNRLSQTALIPTEQYRTAYSDFGPDLTWVADHFGGLS